jgi:hypothetical protein
MDKRGQELPIKTIIALILALLVLVIVIIFFQTASGKIFFSDILEKLKLAFGFANQAKQAIPNP